MKPKKLLLNREKVRELTTREMAEVPGGTELVAAGWVGPRPVSSVLSGHTGGYYLQYNWYLGAYVKVYY